MGFVQRLADWGAVRGEQDGQTAEAKPDIRFCDSCQGSVPCGQPMGFAEGRSYCVECWDRLRLATSIPRDPVEFTPAGTIPGEGGANAAMTLGTIGLICDMTLIGAPVGFVLGIIALPLANSSMRRLKRLGRPNGRALAAWILGFVTIIVGAVVSLISISAWSQ